MPSPMVLNLPRYTKGRKYETVCYGKLTPSNIKDSITTASPFPSLILLVTFDTYQWENDGYLIASEGLKHRVFETSLADLQGDEEHAYRKMRLRAEDVQGRTVLTNFWGINFTTDKLRSLVRKWETLIEAHVDVKTPYLYTLRMFCIGFTKRCRNQVKRTCYAQSSQIRQVAQKQLVLVLLGLPHFRC
ncbi:hypothetical protein M0R45_024485 [Rubus argutus]|uniref:40S ribosomal protein S3a n=1 Tax=Rubus argutus TaxID=59490 RepID=A0AAW1WR46_RUBAR